MTDTDSTDEPETRRQAQRSGSFAADEGNAMAPITGNNIRATGQTEPVVLVFDDPRVQRIAAALAEGIDGRSFASPDAKKMAKKYARMKTKRPDLSFSDCRREVYAEFITEVFTGSMTP